MNYSKKFFGSLKSNTTIHDLTLDCGYGNNIGVGHEFLRVYQENNNRQLTGLRIIVNADLDYGGYESVTNTLRCCTNLIDVCLRGCNISGEHFSTEGEDFVS